jgi:hypothetical protein
MRSCINCSREHEHVPIRAFHLNDETIEKVTGNLGDQQCKKACNPLLNNC